MVRILCIFFGDYLERKNTKIPLGSGLLGGNFLRAQLAGLAYIKRDMTVSPPLQQVGRTSVRYHNRKLTYFAGCDYFRLASHPAILEATATGLARYGLNVAASRVTTGNHELYEKLERDLAGFFGAPTATLAANGYAPNLMVAQALAGQFSHALIDERAHGSLADAAQLLDCPVLNFKHRDAADLARILKRLGRTKPFLLTDGMFSHDGGIAPLKEYMSVVPANAVILLDDAHGVGVLGKNGRGSPEHAGVSTRRIIQTMTLSKAFGVYGGAVLGARELRAAIVTRSRLFAGNTPLPLPLANAAIKSVAILKNGRRLRARNSPRTQRALKKNWWPAACRWRSRRVRLFHSRRKMRERLSASNDACWRAEFIRRSLNIPAGRRVVSFGSPLPASTHGGNWMIWRPRCWRVSPSNPLPLKADCGNVFPWTVNCHQKQALRQSVQRRRRRHSTGRRLSLRPPPRPGRRRAGRVGKYLPPLLVVLLRHPVCCLNVPLSRRQRASGIESKLYHSPRG